MLSRKGLSDWGKPFFLLFFFVIYIFYVYLCITNKQNRYEKHFTSIKNRKQQGNFKDKTANDSAAIKV